MKKSVKEGLLRGLSAIFASLLVLMLILSSVAQANQAVINRELKTSSYVTESGDSTTDTAYYKPTYSSVAELEAAKHQLAASIGAEGSVLLKNADGALPISAGSDAVTVWGLNSLFPTLAGLMGSSVAAATDAGQKEVGILDALGMKGVNINCDMAGFYGQFYDQVRKGSMFGAEIPGHGLSINFNTITEPVTTYPIGELSPDTYTPEVLASADGTTAIVILSRDSSETADYFLEMKDPNGDSYERPLALSDNEKALLGLAKEHSNGKVIVLLNTDVPMEIEELKQDPDVDAILWVGLPGMYGFEGVADVIVGNVSPSGRMPDTYAVSTLSSPAMVNFGLTPYANASSTANSPLTPDMLADYYYAETQGIYIGYKYYETRYEDQILNQGNATNPAGSTSGSAWNYADEVSYPFGFGGSYTTFTQELKSVDVQVGGTSTAVVTVTNTGSVAGKDVVELFVQAPYTAGGLEKAAIQLVNFGKTGVLEPGASEDVTIEFDAQYFASYDESAVKANGTAGAWVLEAGDYYFAIGNGAHNALNNVLAAKTGSTDGLVTVDENEVINGANAIQWNLGATDIETYSQNVVNALQEADINKLIPGAVEYTTRADWSKGWTRVAPITATEQMLVGLQNRTYILKENSDYDIAWGEDNGLTLANMMQFDSNGNYIGTLPFTDPQWDTLVREVTLSEAIQFLENCTDEFDAIPSIGLSNVYNNDGPLGFTNDQVPGYAAKWSPSNSYEPTYVGPDNEYATWTMAEMPTEPVVAATFNQELVEQEGELLGEDGLWTNISGLQGPGVNLHTAPYCARCHEYYSEDAMLSNRMALAICTGTWSKGTWCVMKHMAINDMESNRSGLSTFTTEQAARENGLRAFQGPCTSDNLVGVMTAYNRIGTVFAGGVRGMVTQILRTEWGFNGWCMTDYAAGGFDYMNWLDNIYAGGGGLLCTTANYSSSNHGSMSDSDVQAQVVKDAAFQHEMQEGLKHFLYTFANSNAMNGVSPDSKVVRVNTWWENAILAGEIGFGVLTAVCLGGYLLVAGKKSK